METRKKPNVIAIDGPAASGKGTLAKALAKHLHFRHLDTGGLYRAVAVNLLKNKADPSIVNNAEDAAKKINERDINSPNLRDEEVGQVASIISTYPTVRKELLKYQREFSNTPPGSILDGRDIGTIVCPDANAKIFLKAPVELRAYRRSKELRLRGVECIESRVLKEMQDRDTRDSERATAPLVAAQDAFEIDTTDLTPEKVFDLALSYVEARMS